MDRAQLDKILAEHADWRAGRGGQGANLRWANLCEADLCEADLREADLREADLREADLPRFQIPQEGALIVWKKCVNGLAKLEIPTGARRTASLIGRKCRAEYARVLWLEAGDVDSSRYDSAITYRRWHIVRPNAYDDDPRVECSSGIHFFLTREEAEAWT